MMLLLAWFAVMEGVAPVPAAASSTDSLSRDATDMHLPTEALGGASMDA